MAHQRLIVLIGALFFVGLVVGKAAASLALAIEVAIRGGTIDIHVLNGAHANGDAGLDMAVGGELLVQFPIKLFGDAVVGFCCGRCVSSGHGAVWAWRRRMAGATLARLRTQERRVQCEEVEG